MIIMNRCDEAEDLDSYRRILKGMNPQVDIIFEDEEGQIEEVTEADMPYDVNAEVIEVSPEAYGIWYIDMLDNAGSLQRKDCGVYSYGLKDTGFSEELLCAGTYGHDML